MHIKRTKHKMNIHIIQTGMPGKGVTSEPVAIRIFFVLTTSELPSDFNAVTSLGPVILPWPLTNVTCQNSNIRHENCSKFYY